MFFYFESRFISEVMFMEEKLLESFLSTLPGQYEVMSGRTFSEAKNERELCLTLLRKWNR